MRQDWVIDHFSFTARLLYNKIYIFMITHTLANICMAQQMDGKPTLVLMAGLPGAGKTTLAFALGKELGWPVLDKDRYKRFFLTNTSMADQLASAFAYEIAFELTYDMLVHQRLSVIFDSAALRTFVIKHAREIVFAADAQLKVVLCSASCEVRRSRVTQRTVSTGALNADIMAIENDIQLFPHLPANTLILHTAKPLAEYIDTAIVYLKT